MRLRFQCAPKKPATIDGGCSVQLWLKCCGGFFPVYFHLLKKVDAVELVGHRIIWSFCWLVVLVFAGRVLKNRFDLPTLNEIQSVFKEPRLLRNLVIAAVLISINWLTFVWAVNNAHKIDASLGYYICPQVIVLLGVVFLRERLNAIQWARFLWRRLVCSGSRNQKAAFHGSA